MATYKKCRATELPWWAWLPGCFQNLSHLHFFGRYFFTFFFPNEIMSKNLYP